MTHRYYCIQQIVVRGVDFLIQTQPARPVGGLRCVLLFLLDHVSMLKQYLPDKRVMHQGVWEQPVERPLGVAIIKFILRVRSTAVQNIQCSFCGAHLPEREVSLQVSGNVGGADFQKGVLSISLHRNQSPYSTLRDNVVPPYR